MDGNAVNVLLIGSTGNGKSTLGNFLINPTEEHIYDNQSFTTARSNLPQTQNVSSTSTVVEIPGYDRKPESKRIPLIVIDTPGLNESATHDLRHMIDIIVQLQKLGKVRACVLVVKFNSKIDMHYKATVKYYSRLLPFLFDKNVIIVMTGFANDDKSIRRRRREHVDVEQVKNTTLREIVESGDLSYDPPIFAMDCLPDDDEEWKSNLSERSALLQYVCSLKPIEMMSLRVAKTDDVRRLDQERIHEWNGQITGYNARLKELETEQQAKEALTETEKVEGEKTAISNELKRLNRQVEDLNTQELVTAAQWSVTDEWRLLRRLNKAFNLKSDWEIHEVDVWQNGKCELQYEESSAERRVWGTVSGFFMRGLHATVTVKTFKRLKYADAIATAKEDIKKAEAKKKTLEDKLTEIQRSNEQYLAELKVLRDYIDEKRQALDQLSYDPMTIEEARKRLEEL